MSFNQVISNTIPVDEIVLNPNEVAARLQTERGFTSDTIEQCLKELQRVMVCKYSFVRVPVAYPDENKIDLGFGVIESKSLFINLKGCGEAFIFAVTTGIGVDRLLMKLSLTSHAKHFITDALASAAAEAACDRAEEIIKCGLKCRPRFSPGYGDLALEIQPLVLDAVCARKLLGITLNKSLLMSPMKSITAIMGVYNEQ